MQYYVGYNLSNNIDVYTNTSGVERRYEKVYERVIKLYKEFDNTFTITVKNQDQKKQFVAGTECELQISDESGSLIRTVIGTVLDDGSTTTTKGQIQFTLSESAMLDLDQIFYHGVLRFTDTDSTVKLLYASTRYDAALQFEVVGDTSPEFIESQLVTQFTIIGDEYSSSSVDAQPNRNSNSALHTAVYYLTDFTGSIKIMGTMSDGASYGTEVQQSEFYLIDRQTYTSATGNFPVSFTGVHKRVAFVITQDDSSTVLSGVDKILYRS